MESDGSHRGEGTPAAGHGCTAIVRVQCTALAVLPRRSDASADLPHRDTWAYAYYVRERVYRRTLARRYDAGDGPWRLD